MLAARGGDGRDQNSGGWMRRLRQHLPPLVCNSGLHRDHMNSAKPIKIVNSAIWRLRHHSCALGSPPDGGGEKNGGS